MPKAYVAFLWHMHQPLYRDTHGGVRQMPWVRLHGTRGYIDMFAILDEFPNIRATFNYTPVLLDQLLGYVDHDAKDLYARIAETPEEKMDLGERKFALKYFFLAHRRAMIDPLPRFRELLIQRGLNSDEVDYDRAVDRFSNQDFRDLKVLFRLAWMGFHARASVPEVHALIEKGTGYTREDLLTLHRVERSLLADILTRGRALVGREQIEITTSPFFHPILPLLIDTDVGSRSLPNAPLPRRYNHPEFAVRQLREARELHEEVFGVAPRGLWPSEGAVSPELIPVASSVGYQWLATDEAILFRSLGQADRRDALYRPYSANVGGAKMDMFFRDRHLSDLIGFTYSTMDPNEAARSFLSHVHRVAEQAGGRAPIIPVILDGENPWESYPGAGAPFLRALYGALSADPDIETVTFSDYLKRSPFTTQLTDLHTGSWIDADLHVWVGAPEKNRGWEYLNRAHEALAPHFPPLTERGNEDQWNAIRALEAAQGSDWFWWFDDTFYSELKEEFDLLFRTHLANAFRHLNLDVPSFLDEPIHQRPATRIRFDLQPVEFIDPEIDGEITHYFEWVGAVVYRSRDLRTHSTMYQTDPVLQCLFIGFNRDHLFIRYDLHERHWSPSTPPLSIAVVLAGPRARHVLKIGPLAAGETLAAHWDDGPLPEGMQVAARRIVEIGIPFDAVDCRVAEAIFVQTQLQHEGRIYQQYAGISMVRPSVDFEASQWSV
ncbi:MAG: hypothetical protein KC466_00075 [Myxococcales bacterium]|nr:hypothetical protein [Myxococcales bacterium]